mgnify:CR=1 FL=1
MATKISQSCGHCGTQWYRGRNITTRLESGPEYVKCSTCYGLNKTDLKWFSEMTKKELRVKWFFSRTPVIIWFYIGAGVFAKEFIKAGVSDDNWSEWKIPLVLICLALFFSKISWDSMVASMIKLEQTATEEGLKENVILSEDMVNLYYKIQDNN